MKFSYVHNNINVVDLEKSIEFYEKAVGMTVDSDITPEDGSFKIVYLKAQEGNHLLELTWLKDWDRAYNLGDNEFHMAFRVDDYDQAHQMHEAMGCIVYENTAMGLYFIADPDGYWIEIMK